MVGHCNIAAFREWLTQWCPKTCNLCHATLPPATESPNTRGPTNRPPQRSSRRPPTRQPPTRVPPTQGPPPPQGACGRPQNSANRVIAGRDAKPNSWPWQALMLKSGIASCGGTLISDRWVVTAAHCIKGMTNSPGSFTIRLGEHDRSKSEGTEQDVPVERVIAHPNYAWNKDYDIGLFKLARPVQMNKYVQPACLPSRDAPVGQNCYITGWGSTKFMGGSVTVLQQAAMPVVSNDVCERANKPQNGVKVTPRMICTGHGGSTRISGCHGDSGGPLVCSIGGRWEVHGAVSHGEKTCSTKMGTYTVFARVNAVLLWIRDTMGRY